MFGDVKGCFGIFIVKIKKGATKFSFRYFFPYHQASDYKFKGLKFKIPIAYSALLFAKNYTFMLIPNPQNKKGFYVVKKYR